MNKSMLLGIFFVLVLASFASADLIVDPTTKNFNIDGGDADSFTFTLNNTYTNQNLTGIGMSSVLTSGLVSNGEFDVSFPIDLIENESKSIEFSYDISSGHKAGMYWENITFNPEGATTPELAISYKIAENKDLSLDFSTTTVSKNPGDSFEVSIVVSNSGNADFDSVDLSINDTTPFGLAFDQNGFSLDYDEQKTVVLSGTIPDDGTSEDYSYNITAVGDGTEYTSGVITVEKAEVSRDIKLEGDFEISELPGEDFSNEITVENIGTVPLEDIALSFVDTPTTDFSLVADPDNLSLAVGEKKTVLINGTIPSDVSAKIVNTFNLQLTLPDESSVKKQFTISPKSMLGFEDLEYDVEFPRTEDPDDTDGDLSDGTSIEVGEGAHVIIEGDIENLFETEMEIDSIDVTLYIDDMDDGDDYDEDESIDDLDDGDDDSFIYEFDVPYGEFDDGDTLRAILSVEGEDENRNKHYAEIEFDFEIEKEQEEVTIVDAYLLQPELSCDRETVLYVKLRNTGTEDLEEDEDNTATLQVRNSKLGLNELVRGIEMDYKDGDRTNEQTFEFAVDASDLDPSTIGHFITIEAMADEDDESDERSVMLTVSECDDSTTTTTQPTTTTQAPTTTTQQQVPQLPGGQESGPNYADIPEEEDSIFGEDSYVLVLLGVIVVLLVIGGVMVATLMKKN